MKFLIILLVLINIGLLTLWIKKDIPTAKTDNYPEVSQLEGKDLKFSELKKFFQNLANEKGAEYAYELLRVAPIPKNIDMHLMGHIVGDVLYKQKGASGIKICTEDFRNACSHTIVVGLLLDKGEQALAEISKACGQAPGGSGAYSMCYHGLGHGVLSYVDFDLKKAIYLCEKVHDAGFLGPEARQCIGGAIMEIITGGDHDKKSWAKMRKIYLKDSDPLYPCNNDFIPDNAKHMCYTYLTPHLFQVAGADLGNPQPEHFKKAFTYCSKVPQNQPGNIQACYGGFGKEFVVLLMGRDIRMNTLERIEKDKFKKVFEFCKLADQLKGVEACIIDAVSSYYWGGENKPTIAILFCTSIEEAVFQDVCFQHLISSVNMFVKDENYRREVCNQIPESFRLSCQKKLLDS